MKRGTCRPLATPSHRNQHKSTQDISDLHSGRDLDGSPLLNHKKDHRENNRSGKKRNRGAGSDDREKDGSSRSRTDHGKKKNFLERGGENKFLERESFFKPFIFPMYLIFRL